MKTATLLILAASTFSFDAAAASPTPDESAAPVAAAPVELAVEVDPTVPNADSVRRRLEASGRSALASVDSPWVVGDRVHVRLTGEPYEYQIRVAAVRRDVTLEEITVGCECNTAELSERVSAEVARVAARFSRLTVKPPKALDLPKLQEPPKPQEPAKPKEPDASIRKPVILPKKPQPPVHTAPRPQVRMSEPTLASRETRRTRVAGVATLIAGSVLLFTGAGFMAAGSTNLIDQWRHYERDWRPLGYTIAGVGLAGVAVGGSLMIVDEMRCRRRHDACSSRGRKARRHDTRRLAMGASR